MVEVFIPALALGALYYISKQEKNKQQEPFSTTKYGGGFSKILSSSEDWPHPRKSGLINRKDRYFNPNQKTDKIYNNLTNERIIKKCETKSEETVDNKFEKKKKEFESLTGENISEENFKHNNMKPFFGSNVKQATCKLDGNEGLLDRMTGRGSQHIKKGEVAPLFKPSPQVQWAHGMPSVTNFFHSRQNPSMRIANTQPFEQIQVGPGLNKGYKSEPDFASGYNSGSAASLERKTWEPKPQITQRMTTFKNTFLGPKSRITNRGIEGKIEKKSPDTFFLNGPERYFTTTGLEKAQRGRSVEVFRPVNRTSTTQEYFGTSNSESDAPTARGNYKQSNKIIGKPFEWTAAKAPVGSRKSDEYQSYQVIPNERTLTEARSSKWGNAVSAVTALIAPISEVLRTTRKENVIGNMRPVGNAEGSKQYPTFNPADKLRTTMKETTIYSKNPTMFINNQENTGMGGYQSAKYQPISNQRDTTNYSSFNGPGNTAVSSNATLYDAAYNARTNDQRECILKEQTPYGNMNIFNGAQNICVRKKDEDRMNNRMFVPQNILKNGSPVETHGCVSVRKKLDNSINCERNRPDILNAFRSNPYSKSLHSTA